MSLRGRTVRDTICQHDYANLFNTRLVFVLKQTCFKFYIETYSIVPH